jgi:hypothetical protein
MAYLVTMPGLWILPNPDVCRLARTIQHIEDTLAAGPGTQTLEEKADLNWALAIVQGNLSVALALSSQAPYHERVWS